MPRRLYDFTGQSFKYLYVYFLLPVQPGHYLGHLIGHEGHGSLLSELKNKGDLQYVSRRTQLSV